MNRLRWMGTPRWHAQHLLQVDARAILRAPAALLEWDVEAEQPVAERAHIELRLGTALVLLMRSGDGGPEARVLALSRVYSRHRSAPALALLLAERLLRSRLVTGATDVETFWLAAAFSGPLDVVASPELRRLTWAYLCHAPFALDPFTLLRFARASMSAVLGSGEPQAFRLGRSLLQLPAQTELGVAVLEALVCATVRAPRMEKAVGRLWDGRQGMPSWFPSLIRLLADHYVRSSSGTFVAREVVRIACVMGTARPEDRAFLKDGLFILPVAELYRWVRLTAQKQDQLDARRLECLKSGMGDAARMLVECELVVRLAPWRMGRFALALRRALRRVLGGADVYDPRIRELAFRWVLLCAETWQYSEEAHHLSRRVLVLPHFRHFLAQSAEAEGVLKEFLQESRPLSLLARERALLIEPWSGVREGVQEGIRDGVRGMQTWVDTELGELQWVDGSGAGEGVEEEAGWGPRFERLVYPLFRLACRGRWVRRLNDQVEGVAGVPIHLVGPTELARLSALARAFAWSDRRAAATVGAVAGFTGGRSGFLIDLVGVWVASVRAIVRIAACYGIAPGTRPCLRFLGDVYRQVFSPDSAARGLSWWLAQRPRIYRMLLLGLALGVSRKSRQVSGSSEPGPSTRWYRRLGRHTPGRHTHGRHAPGLHAPGLHVPGMSARTQARVLPLGAGGVAAGVDYLLMRELTDAALQLGARHWVLDQQRSEADAGGRADSVGPGETAPDPTDGEGFGR